MHSRTRFFSAGLLVVLVSTALAGAAVVSAEATDWKAMRAAGQLGERYDGFLEVRDAVATAAAVEINKARRNLYQKRATEMGVSLDQVGRIYFKENVDKLPSGTWLLRENGDWARK